jgi:LAO/AO transport system kinase
MERLSMQENAFIRPSPSANTLGGVTKSTREAMLLCELAGFDVIIIETVGVGQSEIAVREMCDYFLLLLLAGAGDQLQGIKRGIMEICDGIAITKADGDNALKAQKAVGEFTSALHLFPAKENGMMAKVTSISAIENKGVQELWALVTADLDWMERRGFIVSQRQAQYKTWFHQLLREQAISSYYEQHAATILEAEARINETGSDPYREAQQIIQQG